MGLQVSAEGVRITDDRAEAAKNLRPPRTPKEAMKVLGFLNYNKKFVHKYAEMSELLYLLLMKGKNLNGRRSVNKPLVK